jgi:hypothetical protein
MLPSFLVVGTMKGGTSALVRGVKQHPDVWTPGAKEMHFFDEHFAKGLDWYEAQFAEATPGAVVGEATPGYMYGEEVVDRMTTTLPDARYVAILRDPVDRAYSHYWHNVRRGRESLTFDEALAAESASLDGSDPTRPPVHFAYLDRSRYLDQLRAIEDRAGRTRMLVLDNDDLRHRRAETLRAVWSFIGVDPDRGPVGEPARPFIWHVRQCLSPKRRARAEPYPRLDPEVGRRLRTVVHDDVVALAEWWGRDLSGWRSR